MDELFRVGPAVGMEFVQLDFGIRAHRYPARRGFDMQSLLAPRERYVLSA